MKKIVISVKSKSEEVLALFIATAKEVARDLGIKVKVDEQK
jgi:hypothetical protein|tara:strand:- start:10594 stop:10716 length:123 start_codon:yes stop_codon:yes gene_type:complete